MSAFLLKVANGDYYSTVAGLRTTQMSINGNAVDIADKGPDGWQASLLDARSISITGNGIFTGFVSEAQIRDYALSGGLVDYVIAFEGGQQVQCQFLITRLDYAGEWNGERSYTISLESSGPVIVKGIE